MIVTRFSKLFGNFALALLLTLVSNPMLAGKLEPCHVLAAEFKQQTNRKKIQPQAWLRLQLTNPKSHDPNRFTYLVHADGQLGTRNNLPLLGGGGYLSASLINESHPGTFRVAGYILAPPNEAIIAAAPGDMMFSSSWRRFTTPEAQKNAIRKEYGLMAPEELLANTETYNEVIIAKPDIYSGVGLTIVGLFIKKKPTGLSGKLYPNDIKSIEKAKELAKQYGLPLIVLP